MFNRNTKFNNFKRERSTAISNSTCDNILFPEEITSERPATIHTRFNRRSSDALNNQQMENRTFNFNDTLTNYEELQPMPEMTNYGKRVKNNEHLKVIQNLGLRSKSNIVDKNQCLIHNNLKTEVIKLQNEIDGLAIENFTEEEWFLCGAEIWKNHEYLVKQFYALLNDFDNVNNHALSNSCFNQLNKLASIQTQILALFGENGSELSSAVIGHRHKPTFFLRNNKNTSNVSNENFQLSKDFDKILNLQSSRAHTQAVSTSETMNSSQSQINSLLFDMIDKCASFLSQQQSEIVNLREAIEKFNLNAQSSANPFHYDRLLANGNRNLQLNVPFQGSNYQNGLHTWSPSSQALNNKVAPGNRANNFLDNFKSNSRQNFFTSSTNLERYYSNPNNNNKHELAKATSFSLGDFNSSTTEKREANISAIIHNRNNLKENLNENENMKDDEGNVKNGRNAENAVCQNQIEEIDLESTLATLYNDEEYHQPGEPIPVSISKDLIRETANFLRNNAEKQQYLKDLLGYLRLFKSDLQRESLIKTIASLLKNDEVDDQVQNPSEDQ